MSFLCIGDLHFRKDNIRQMDAISNEILTIARKYSPSQIVVLGDVLNDHEKIYQIPFYNASKFLLQLTEIAPTVCLIGNHDRINNSVFMTDMSPFFLAKSIPNLTIVDKTLRVGDIIYVPYVKSGRFFEALSTVDYSPMNTTIVFGHQEFGFACTKTYTSKCPECWGNENCFCITGHYHDYHRVGRCIWMGASCQQSYDEDYHKYCCLVEIQDEAIGSLNLEDTETEQMPNGKYVTIQKIPIYTTMHKITTRITKEQLLANDYTIDYNADNKIILTVPQNEVQSICFHEKYIELKKNVSKIEIAIDAKSKTTQEKEVHEMARRNKFNFHDVFREVIQDDELYSFFCEKICDFK